MKQLVILAISLVSVLSVTAQGKRHSIDVHYPENTRQADEKMASFQSDDFTFRILSESDLLVELDGYKPSTNTKRQIELPSYVEYDNKTYTLVSLSDRAFCNAPDTVNLVLTDITLPSTVKNVSGKAFASCRKLKWIDVSEGNPYYKSEEGVLYSSDGKVMYSYPVKSYMTILPSSVCEIPEGVEEIGSYCFYMSEIRELSLCETLRVIGESAFQGCTFTKVCIPDSVVDIQRGAFRDNNKLVDVHLPEGLIQLGAYAFYKTSLSGMLSLPAQLEEIGAYAFYGNHISEVVFPPTLKNLGECAFRSYGWLKSIQLNGQGDYFEIVDNLLIEKDKKTVVLISRPDNNGVVNIPEGVLHIRKDAAASANREYSLVLPGSIVEIAEGHFADSRITAVTFSDGTLTIGDASFKGSALKSVTLPASLQYLGIEAFAGCENLEDVEFKGNLASIGDAAFRKTSIKKLHLSDNIRQIGDYAFADCSELEDIKLPLHLEIIGREAFRGCRVKNLEIEASLRIMGYAAFKGSEYMYTLDLKGGAEEIRQEAFSSCTRLREVTLGEGTVAVGVKAFSSCGQLTSLKLPVSLESVGDRAFEDTDLINGELVELSHTGLKEVGDHSMAGLKIDALPRTLCNIGEEAFKGCTFDILELGNGVDSWGKAAFMATTAGEFILNEGIKTIPTLSFLGMSVTSGLSELIIPDGVESIYWGALCRAKGENLKKVVFPETLDTCIDPFFFEMWIDSETTPITYITDVENYYFLSGNGVDGVLLITGDVKAHMPVDTEDVYLQLPGFPEASCYFDIVKCVALEVPDNQLRLGVGETMLLEASVDNFLNMNLTPPRWECVDPSVAEVSYDSSVDKWVAKGLRTGQTDLLYGVKDAQGNDYVRKLTLYVGDVAVDAIGDDADSCDEVDTERIFTVDGKEVMQSRSELTSGIYIIVSDKTRKKIIVK